VTEYFRITGKNDILFDAGPMGNYLFTKGRPPRKLSTILTRKEVLAVLPRLPLGIRPTALQHGLSVITMEVNIRGATDTEMESLEHDLIETLVETDLFFSSQGARGTRAVLTVKSDGAVATSYKSVFYGFLDELDARDVLGAVIKAHSLEGLRLVLYCEENWRPNSAIELGPNEINCPSFEENADSGVPNQIADNWTLVATPIPTWESTIVAHGCYSQKLVTDAVNEGIDSAVFASGAAGRDGVAYAWIYKSAGGEVRVQMYETGVAMRAEALLSTAGWQTKVVNGNTWYRVVVSGTMPNNANHNLRIIADDAATTFYVDKCYWEWDTLVCPDEWISYPLIFNHYDARWLPNKAGGAGAGDVGHINYVDVDGLKGDVDARLLMRTEFEQKADEDYVYDLMVGRRTRYGHCGFLWWIEGEEGAETNWGALGLARCSGGSRCTDGANATGYVQWNLRTLYGGLLYAPQYAFGDFDVYAAVYTNDKDNTQYRLSSFYQTDEVSYNPWTKQTLTSLWELIPLGQIHFDPITRPGIEARNLYFRVEYAKEAGDTVELDCIWLIPRNEPEMRLSSAVHLTVDDLWAVGQTMDFDYDGLEFLVGAVLYWFSPLTIQGGVMALEPGKENRLYFAAISSTGSPNYYKTYEVHSTTDLRMLVNLEYLPQFVSPLE